MDFLPLPSTQLPTNTYAEVRQARSSQTLSSPPSFNRYIAGLPTELPIEVQSQLQLFLEALPEPSTIAQQVKATLIAQAGPIKPNSLPKPKPKDKPRPVLPPPVGEKLNVVSDRQEYDINTQVFVAEGNVVITYKKSELKADRVQLNTKTQEVVAEGNVFFKRGDQKIRGSKLTYNYSTVKGELLKASGAVDIGKLQNSEVSQSAADIAPNSITVSATGATNSSQGQVGRLGFIAERVMIDGDIWTAENLRVTNDPFTPPELQIVTSKATLTPTSPTQNRLDLESPTIIFDQGFSLPVPVNSITIDRFQRSAPALIAFDRIDRGGAFYQQTFDVIAQPNLSFQVSPQLLIQRAFTSQNGFSGLNIFGLVATLDGAFDDGSSLAARASLSGLNLYELDSILRANASYRLPVFGNYTLLTQYAFRDRVFNGSLGFQDVNNVFGPTLISPNYILGDSKISLSYQLSTQLIGALRSDLQPNTVGSLIRVQGAAVISRSFPLLRGEPLPAEKETGLRFSPQPIVPKLDAFLTAVGVSAYYSNGANQSVLYGTVGLAAEVGNFSKDFLDYTGLNVSYTQAFPSGQSPFFFDSVADTKSLTAGIVQQIYGPIRFGIQQSWSLVNGTLFDSVYSLEYARRTYSVVVRYNPQQGLGEFLIRISDFNWTRPPSNVTTIQDGLEQRN
ncbi:MAG: DUF3769 domain-containing protein [Pseudanabaena sp.]|nr:MAG: DUF3769 domain-containing protein [Pseudanabaena sp.]